jgi:prevent-host-death family protein
MTRILNLYEAKAHLSKLVEQAAAGEEIVIAKAGTPKARLVPLRKQQRKPGGWEGRIRVSEDFDDELPADVLGGFLGADAGEPP